jgi:hypothetical protein
MKEKRRCVTVSSGILINIRITFDKERRSYTKYASGILTSVRITSMKDKRRCVTVSSGILINIRITFDKEKRRYTQYASGIFTSVRITFNERETKMRYGLFRYSHSIFEYRNIRAREARGRWRICSTMRNEGKQCCIQGKYSINPIFKKCNYSYEQLFYNHWDGSILCCFQVLSHMRT